ncbi:MAG: UDP-N-acetylmuramate:L-alanyl-gamma-D-glutamyl-meso-diaminopimelate ligase [Gammaproteobacteria bacterium]|nr:UDP-N-acetylmuramate:L-alanyl-gamma-D-glutamyl-meso-diaminopimelate ligase [Gammaproteobacteria bacterium]
MHIHILGICGTFMGGLALLARGMRHRVTGSDSNVYPPMSTQLASQGIELYEGYDEVQFKTRPDVVVIGNALSRGNPAVEYVLNNTIPYVSGPEFLAREILSKRWVLAVAGTHGKTTTASMVAHILNYAGMSPGFLIGGIAHDLEVSASLGKEPFFVIEADEYDTAFFDKRSKFVHYQPRTLVLNNLEYDHADIFPDLDAIKRQFNHLMRIVPANGLVVNNADDENLKDVLAQGCWTSCESFSSGQHKSHGWHIRDGADDYSRFDVYFSNEKQGTLQWQLTGAHNVANALAAIGAARHSGVPTQHAIEALNCFSGVARRLQKIAYVNDITVYDDFAHHPTAIKTTLDGLRRKVGQQRIIAVFEPRSNTMRMGVHEHTLAASFVDADEVMLYAPDEMSWNIGAVSDAIGKHSACWVKNNIEELGRCLLKNAKAGDHIVIMSNGDFSGLRERIVDDLAQQQSSAIEN